MNQFVQRVANYVANEILIKGLANSKTFQRFAVRTDKSVKEVHKQSTEQFQTVFENMTAAQQQQVRSTSTQAGTRQAPIKPLTGVPGFFAAFFKEIRKDLGGKAG